MNERHETVLWATKYGTFLLETGYYAEVPCDRCGTPSEIEISGEHFCHRHHDRGADAPVWIKAWHAR